MSWWSFSRITRWLLWAQLWWHARRRRWLGVATWQSGHLHLTPKNWEKGQNSLGILRLHDEWIWHVQYEFVPHPDMEWIQGIRDVSHFFFRIQHDLNYPLSGVPNFDLEPHGETIIDFSQHMCDFYKFSQPNMAGFDQPNRIEIRIRPAKISWFNQTIN